jgi:hypothetical protein
MRQKFVWVEGENGRRGSWVPAEEYYAAKYANVASSPYVMPDIVSFRSPCDYSEVGSRSQLREHNKRNNVVQLGDLKTAKDFDNKAIQTERLKEANRKAFAEMERKR